MRADVRRNVFQAIVTFIGITSVVLAFQNCGKAGFDDTGSDASKDSATKDTTVSFAFNSAFDQITYNSCFGAGLTNNPAFFTIKAGAYEAGGVNLTQSFINDAKAKLTPQYPATTVTVEQMKAFVGETAENTSATLQMALRTRGSPQQVRNPTGAAPTLGVDFINLLMDLTDDRVMEPIFRAQGGVVNYFPLAPNQNQRVMEGKITYNADEGIAYSLRNDLSSNGMLGLTYTAYNGGSAFAARMPGTTSDPSLAYGRGYVMTFAADVAPMTQIINNNPAVQPHSKNPNNILVNISEVDLQNPSAAGPAWTCAPGRRYLIVKSEDAATYCPSDSVSRLSDLNYRRELEIIRRHLPPEQWDVSVDRRCVVPKSGSCYRNSGGTAEEPVEYNQALECYQGIQGLANPNITKRCAQYVSICLRN